MDRREYFNMIRAIVEGKIAIGENWRNHVTHTDMLFLLNEIKKGDAEIKILSEKIAKLEALGE